MTHRMHWLTRPAANSINVAAFAVVCVGLRHSTAASPRGNRNRLGYRVVVRWLQRFRVFRRRGHRRLRGALSAHLSLFVVAAEEL
jgi:hypothetical protein